jgi:hypothetical protein
MSAKPAFTDERAWRSAPQADAGPQRAGAPTPGRNSWNRPAGPAQVPLAVPDARARTDA